MAKGLSLTNTWETIREVDLRPLREEALKVVKIAIVGSPGSGRSVLADKMRCDPERPQLQAQTPIWILDLENFEQAIGADLIILLVDSRERDTVREQEMVRSWHNRGQRVLVFINQFEQESGAIDIVPGTVQRRGHIVWGSPHDDDFLLKQFAPQVIDLLRDQLLSLGRHFPFFRVPIARYMINDTCVSNAAYAFSTGLAEIVAVLNIPIAVTDMVILSKNQAYLAYKLGLALGFSTRWQDYVVEFGGVLGSGFIWREIARTLVGLVPVWGIVPKTAIAYAGTYVIGQAILQWYLTGRHISKGQMRQIYQQALANGREIARRFFGKLHLPRLPKISRPKLPALPRPRQRRKSGALADGLQVCAKCDQLSATDAQYCQYCGEPLGDMMAGRDPGTDELSAPKP